MDTELTLAACALLCAGVAMTVLGLAHRAGKLRRNCFVGIRTPRTLRDDGAWQRAHANRWLPLIASGALVVIGASAALAIRPETSATATALLLVPTGSAAAILVAVAIRGTLDARAPDSER
jgi:uncharacterized membrane protein